MNKEKTQLLKAIEYIKLNYGRKQIDDVLCQEIADYYNISDLWFMLKLLVRK